MARIDANFLRSRYPQLKDASDSEIAQLAHQAFSPQSDYRQFETAFLGESSATQELGRGLVRGARTLKAGLDFAAGGVASVFGDQEGADAAFKSYDENMAAIRRGGARRNFTDIRSVGDAVDWASGMAGEAAPALLTGGSSVAGQLATQGLTNLAQGNQRVEQLMPDASTDSKKLALAGIAAVGTVGDAFIPAKLLRGGGKPGPMGVVRDVGQAAAIGGATPLAERAIAAGATDGDGWETFSRGGGRQIGTEVIEGAAGSGLSAGIARPIMRVNQAVADRAGQAFSKFRRTETGEVDLTGTVEGALRNTAPADSIPAYRRRGLDLDIIAERGAARGVVEDPTGQRDMFGGSGRTLDARPQVDETGAPYRDTATLDMFARTPEDMVGAQGDLFDGETMPLPQRGEAPAPAGIQRNRRQGELDFNAQSQRDTVFVDSQGNPVPRAVVEAPDNVRQRAAALQTDAIRTQESAAAAATMAKAKPGQTPDMFGGKPRPGPMEAPAAGPEPTAPADPREVSQRVIDPSLLTKTDLLRELNAASRDTGIAAMRGGKPVGGKNKYGIAAILDSQDPVAAIREAYQDGGNEKAELLDMWHERLTGEKLSAPRPAEAPAAAPAPAQQATAAAAPTATPAETAAPLGQKFGANEDLRGRAERGMVEMQALLRRAQDMLKRAKNKPERERAEETAWSVEEEIKDMRAALKGKEEPRATAVANLERAVAQWRAWEDRIAGKAGAAGFDPSLKVGEDFPTIDASLLDAAANDTPLSDSTTRLQSDMRARTGNPEYRLREIDSLTGRPNARALRFARWVAETAFGREVVFVDQPNGGLFYGAQFDGKVFIDVNSPKPAISILGHELTHDLRKTRPELYDRLNDSLGTLLRGESDYAQKLRDDYAEIGLNPLDADKSREELFSDIVGDRFDEPAFWREMAAADGSLFSKVARHALTLIDNALERLTGTRTFGTERYVSDLRAARKAIADVFREYAAANRQELIDLAEQVRAETTPDPVMLSVARARASEGDVEHLARVGTAGITLDMKQRARVLGRNAGSGTLAARLNLLATSQIVEQWGGKVRGAKDLYEAMSRKFSAEYGTMATADAALKRMLDLPKFDRDRLTDLMYDATLAELHPDKPLADQIKDELKLTQGQVDAHAILARKYEALSPEAKKAYQGTRAVLDKQFVEVVSSLRRLVERVEPDAAARAERLKQIDNMVGKVRGPYFPLSRFGDYVLIAKNAASDGRTIVQHFETPGEMMVAKEDMMRRGITADKIVTTRRDDGRYQQEVSSPFVEGVRSAIDANITDADQRQALSTALNELIIRALPAASGAKNFLRRRNVEGFSTDAARSLADSVVRAGRYISNLNFTPDMNAAIIDLQQFHPNNADQMPVYAQVYQEDGQTKVDVYTSASERLRAQDALLERKIEPTTVRATLKGLPEALAGAGVPENNILLAVQQAEQARNAALGPREMEDVQTVASHLRAQAAAMVGPTSENQVFQALGRLAHIKYLGLSPAYWLTNLAQVPTMSFPDMAARYGVAATAAELGRAARPASHAFKLLVDHLAKGRGAALDLENMKGVTKEEVEAIQFLADRGQIDYTLNADLSHTAKGASDTGKAFNTAVEYITAGAHYTEVFNRMVTGLATYRLARAKGDGHQAAMRDALDTVSRTQFNYAEYNKPGIMKTRGPLGAPARLVFMFQQYAQNTLYWWGRNLQRATKGESVEVRREAAKAMGLSAAGLMLMGGAAGLPLMGTVHMLANMIGRMFTDDEGFEAEDIVDEALREMGASEATAKALRRGIFTVAGTDLSERIGQGDLLGKLGLTERQMQSAAAAQNPELSIIMNFLGPVGSMGVEIPRIVSAIQEGDALKAFSFFPVKGVADIAKAVEYGTQGVRSQKGDVYIGADELSAADVVMKGVGFQPAQVTELYRDRTQQMAFERRIQDKKSRIITLVARGIMADDDEAFQDGLDALMEFNEKVIDKYPQLAMTGKQLEDAVKRKIREQIMLGLTGGRAKNQKAMMLAMQLNPGANWSVISEPSAPTAED